MKIKVVLLLLLALFSHQGFSQNEANPPSLLHQKSVQLGVGTQGIGVEFNYGVLPKVVLSLGGHIIPLQARDLFEISGLNSTSEVSAKFYNLNLMADYTPFESLRWLRFVGGVAYFIKAKGDVAIHPTDRYNYGDLELSQEQVGHVDLGVDWNGFAPYAGVGLADIFPDKTFGVNFDLGTYFLDSPSASIVGTGILAGNSTQSGQLEHNVRSYRWLPVLQINFNLKL